MNLDKQDIINFLYDMCYVCCKNVEIKDKHNKISPEIMECCTHVFNHFKVCCLAGGYSAFISKQTNTYGDIGKYGTLYFIFCNYVFLYLDFFIPVFNLSRWANNKKIENRLNCMCKQHCCCNRSSISSLITKLKKHLPQMKISTVSRKSVNYFSHTCLFPGFNLLKPNSFYNGVYDPYFIAHITEVYFKSNIDDVQFSIQLIFVSSIFISNTIYPLYLSLIHI